jgi:hypothetical protein
MAAYDGAEGQDHVQSDSGMGAGGAGEAEGSIPGVLTTNWQGADAGDNPIVGRSGGPDDSPGTAGGGGTYMGPGTTGLGGSNATTGTDAGTAGIGGGSDVGGGTTGPISGSGTPV